MSDLSRTEARVSPSDSVRTVGTVIDHHFNELDRRAVYGLFAALGLDPATVLDGPVVVLHPGQHVVEFRVPQPGELVCGDSAPFRKETVGFYDWPVVVASNPQERTP
jgi:hypothetical protein